MQTAHTICLREAILNLDPRNLLISIPLPGIELSNMVAAACLPVQLPGSMHSTLCHRWQLLNPNLLNLILSCILGSLHHSTPTIQSPAETKKSKIGEEHDRTDHGIMSNVPTHTMLLRPLEEFPSSTQPATLADLKI